MRTNKQTIFFKLSNATFFKREKDGSLQRLRHDASGERILAAAGGTLKLDNQKNGWKGVCVHHEANGDYYFCPVKALARRYTRTLSRRRDKGMEHVYVGILR